MGCTRKAPSDPRAELLAVADAVARRGSRGLERLIRTAHSGRRKPPRHCIDLSRINPDPETTVRLMLELFLNAVSKITPEDVERARRANQKARATPSSEG